jgi:hypothetical protein
VIAKAPGNLLDLLVREHPQGLFGKNELLGQIGLFHRLSLAVIRGYPYRGRVRSRRGNETAAARGLTPAPTRIDLRVSFSECLAGRVLAAISFPVHATL